MREREGEAPKICVGYLSVLGSSDRTGHAQFSHSLLRYTLTLTTQNYANRDRFLRNPLYSVGLATFIHLLRS